MPMLFLQKKGPLTLEHKEEGPVEAIPEHPERPLTQEWERGAATSQVIYRARPFLMEPLNQSHPEHTCALKK